MLVVGKMHTQLILERAFLGDNKFVFALRRSSPLDRRGRCLYRFKVECKGERRRKSFPAGRESPSKDPNESSLDGIAAAAAAGAQMAAEESWIELEDDDDDDDDSSDTDEDLKRFKGLVLDLAYRPINVVSWKRSLCLEILDKAEVLVYYDQIVCSPSRAFFIPAVLRMSNYIYAPKPKSIRLSLSKTNVFIRDKFKCQYCHCDRDLTIDHVHPVSKGGGHSWDNLVTACKYCNGKKGSRTLEDAQMKLEKLPKEPSLIDRRELPPSYRVFKSIVLNKVPSEWIDYLPRRPSKLDHL